jgi:large subunit ribosomal protein L5
MKDDKYIDNIEKTLTAITGQKPVKTHARQSISGFKIREGQIVGMKVTLHGSRMYNFVDKLIHTVIPRIRDFRGLDQKSLDQQGNLNIGFREHLAFPEINPDAVDTAHGLEVVIKTTASNKDQGLKLFKLLGFPFKK